MPWYCDIAPGAERDCPVDILTTWARRGLTTDSRLVQTEPYYYWWYFPRASHGKNDYPAFQAANRDVGKPTANFVEFSKGLGVALPPAAQ